MEDGGRLVLVHNIPLAGPVRMTHLEHQTSHLLKIGTLDRLLGFTFPWHGTVVFAREHLKDRTDMKRDHCDYECCENKTISAELHCFGRQEKNYNSFSHSSMTISDLQ